MHGLFERAAAIDDGQTALDLMTQCSGHSWCNMVLHNATTSWEMWGATEGTHSHPWSTTPASAIPAGLMGVRPTEPGWAKWIAKPAAGNLSSASITIPTLHGPIHSRLNNSVVAGRFELGLTVPAGTEATACLRKLGSGSRLLLNGAELLGSEVEAVEPAYLCAAGLTRRSGGQEHVLLRLHSEG